jgi:hypothetical protein
MLVTRRLPAVSANASVVAINPVAQVHANCRHVGGLMRTSAMRSVYVVVALCTAFGCGRIGFDTAMDSVDGGHDEDGDGVADVLDDCPHIANRDQANSDTDLVGDACDSEPTIGRQRLLVFEPCVALSSDWLPQKLAEPISNISDDCVFGTAATFLARNVNYADADITVIGKIVSVSGSDRHQFVIATDFSDGTRHWLNEIFHDSAMSDGPRITFQYVVEQTGNYTKIASKAIADPFVPGEFVATLRPRVGGITTFDFLQIGGPGNNFSIEGPDPAYQSIRKIAFGAEGNDLRIHSITIIAKDR